MSRFGRGVVVEENITEVGFEDVVQGIPRLVPCLDYAFWCLDVLGQSESI